MLPATSVYRRAHHDLRVIRSTIERAATFTAVPGVGMCVMGVSAIVAAFVGAATTTPQAFLTVWLVELGLAFSVGVGSMIHKARRAGVPLLRGCGLRFLVALVPPFVAAGVLSVWFWQNGHADRLPALWLLLYGVGVLTGGASSIRSVLVLGGVFFALGTIAAFAPTSATHALLGIGFGGLHLLFGLYIARKHGG
ncbi:MAG: hypothetical protein IPH13_15810 [Planctomycetes bacterium]|nr:hypothetical protein [Planctomycetota bacterium]MCC7171533.1 hypothetical protein [Planctomycetota bacterium]